MPAQDSVSAIYVGVVGYLGGGRRHYADETNIAYFLQQPDVLMLQALLLKTKPVDLDPLPLYFLLMLVFPVLLWASGPSPDSHPHLVRCALCRRKSAGLETCRLIRAEDGISIRSPGSCCLYSGLGARSVARTASAGSSRRSLSSILVCHRH
jgi:OpgC protein